MINMHLFPNVHIDIITSCVKKIYNSLLNLPDMLQKNQFTMDVLVYLTEY